MKNLVIKMVLLVGLSIGSYANGIDGFFASLGYGISKVDTDFETVQSGWNAGKNETQTGIASSLKLGYGLSDDLAIYLFRDGAFVHDYKNIPNDDIYANCVTGLGVLYYFEPANIFYTFFGMGTGGFTKFTDVDPTKRDSGDGYVLGLGVNIIDNIHAEISLLNSEIDTDIEIETTATRFIISYYWY